MKSHDDLYLYFDNDPNSDNIEFLEDRDEITVFWSGGLDSTALLYCLANKFPKKHIHALTIALENAGCNKADKKCREKLKKRFEKEGLNNIIYHESNLGICTGGWVSGGLGQPVAWLASLGIAAYCGDNAICFGYIKGDDIWHYMEYFKRAFKNLIKISNAKNVSLHFPLGFVQKQDIIEYMKHYKLFNLCNWCELADTKNGPCGRCKDCEAVEFYELKKLKGQGIISKISKDVKKSLFKYTDNREKKRKKELV